MTKEAPDYWDRIMADERLNRARKILSMHELRLLLIHARNEWRPISTLPTDDRMVFAYCPPCSQFPAGRKMTWKASILVDAMKDGTPQHLRYPATHWTDVPDDPPASLSDRDVAVISEMRSH